MANILLVIQPSQYTDLFPARRVLTRLGHTVRVAYLEGIGSSVFRTDIGTIDPESSTARDYLRTFDAVFVIDRYDGNWYSSGLSASARWMRWNTDADPPVCYFGLNLNAGATSLNTRLPADFPIRRYTLNDPTTCAAAETDGNSTLHAYRGGIETTIAGGTPCRLLRENVRLYVWCPSTHSTNTPYNIFFVKLDPTKHTDLSNEIFTWRGQTMSAGEILAVPDYPESAYSGGRTFDTDTIVAYRYRQHYFLPKVGIRFGVDFPGTFGFWGLYALKLCGIPAIRKFPVYHEFDHFSQVQISQIDLDTALSNYLATYEWLDSFCAQRGTHIVAGTYRSLYYSTGNLFYGEVERIATQDSHQQKFQQLLSFLRETHRRGTIQICLHDHADTGWGYTTHTNTIYRHVGGQYGRPNNVRKRHGQVLHMSQVPDPSVLPEGSVLIEIGNEKFWDIPTGSGDFTGTGHLTQPYQHNSIHHARITIERGINYCTNVLGFPDAFAGEHRYCNTAKNHAGMFGFLQALRDYGVRGIRSVHRRINPGETMAVDAVWNGLVILEYQDQEVFNGYHGLYNPAYNTNWVIGGNFNIGNDISTGWSTSRDALAWRAYQRVMTSSLYQYLRAVMDFKAPYRHPVTSISSAYPSDPTADFDPSLLAHSSIQDANSTVPAFNHIVAVFKEMDKVVSVLSDYLYWGTVSDVMARVKEEGA